MRKAKTEVIDVNVSLRIRVMDKKRILGAFAMSHTLLLMVALSGCSSLGIHASDWGHPYLGTEFAVKKLPCTLVNSGSDLFAPVPFVLADIPLTFVIDTLLLPADAVVTPARSRHVAIEDLESRDSCRFYFLAM